jgi:hypothetical protein
MFAAEHNDHDIFRSCRKMNDTVRCDIRRFFQKIFVALMTFAARRNIRKRHGRMLPEIFFDLLFRDPVARHDLRVFDAEGDQRSSTAEAADVEMATP